MFDQSDALSISQKLTQNSPPNNKHRKQFLFKLFTLLEQNKHSDIISWSDDGQYLLLKDPARIAEVILPKLFTHCNYPSFVRQFSFYRFKKVSQRRDETRVYYHPSFRRGRMDLVEQIERTTAKKITTILSTDDTQTQAEMDSLNELFDQNSKKRVIAMTRHQDGHATLINQLQLANNIIKSLKEQNHALNAYLFDAIIKQRGRATVLPNQTRANAELSFLDEPQQTHTYSSFEPNFSVDNQQRCQESNRTASYIFGSLPYNDVHSIQNLSSVSSIEHGNANYDLFNSFESLTERISAPQLVNKDDFSMIPYKMRDVTTGNNDFDYFFNEI